MQILLNNVSAIPVIAAKKHIAHFAELSGVHRKISRCSSAHLKILQLQCKS